MGLLDYIKANTPRATTPRVKPGKVFNEGLLNPNAYNKPAADRFKDSLFGGLGIVPGVGDVAAGMEAADLWNRGDKGMAALAGLGVLPVIPNMVHAGSMFQGKKLPSVKTLSKVKDKFIYHSGVADDIENMKYGIEPTNQGEWVTEIAQGATDNHEELLENSVPLSWFSDEPNWVAMKVARKLRKNVNDVTDDDIVKYGHVAMVPRKGDHAKDVYYVGDEGLINGPYSKVKNLRGEEMNAGMTDLYQEGNYGQRLEPFGVEQNEYITTNSIEPMFQLSGQELLQFLQNAGVRGLLK